MAAVAFLEIIDRAGELGSRHAITRWPCRVGRGYDMDVILDDPHVAPAHAELSLNAAGGVEIRDLGSLNGTSRGHAGRRMMRLAEADRSAPLAPDEWVRLGQTTFRIRLPGQAVAPERLLEKRQWMRSWVVALPLVILLILLFSLQTWNLQDEPEVADVLSDAWGRLVLLLLWVVIWATSGRIATGVSLVSGHTILASVAGVAWVLGDVLIKTVAFSLGIGSEPHLTRVLGIALLVGFLLYKHFRLISRRPRMLLLTHAFLVALFSVGGVGGMKIHQETTPDKIQYQPTILPRALLLTEGLSREEFVREFRQELPVWPQAESIPSSGPS
ncbi:MAG: FHA domain-containing protein [Magnetococcales bacterium]|nr:FHA domain-containing protein [Magnetococcales bacterium]